MSVNYFICDVPASKLGSSPGYAIRCADLTVHLKTGADGAVVLAPPRHLGTRAGRIAWTVSLSLRRWRNTRVFVLFALGRPHLLILGLLLNRLGHTVVVDLCDSVQSAGLKARISRLALRQARARDRLFFTYITMHDRAHDAELLGGDVAFVVPPVVNASDLTALPPVRSGPTERLVAYGDFSSPHNEEGISLLLSVYEAQGALFPPLEIFGPTSPRRVLPEGVSYKGFALERSELFSGQTTVFASNTTSVGYQNKIGDALLAGRPVIARAASPVFDGEGLLYRYHSETELADILSRAATAGLVDASARRWEGRDMLNESRVLLSRLSDGGDQA